MHPIIDWANLRARDHTGWRGDPSKQPQIHRWFLSAPIKPTEFDCCPICFSSANLTKEHVPPFSIGGVVLVNTCGDCNSKLGSRVDEDVRRWVHVSDPNARIQLDGVIGNRKLGEFAVREFEGKPVLAIAGTGDPTVTAALTSPSLRRLTLMLHEPRRFRIGLLKSAYLATCAVLGEPPTGLLADEVRGDLAQARDGQLSLDSDSALAASIRTLTCETPEPLWPRIFVFFDGDETRNTGIAMSSFVVYGPVIEALLAGLNVEEIPIEDAVWPRRPY